MNPHADTLLLLLHIVAYTLAAIGIAVGCYALLAVLRGKQTVGRIFRSWSTSAQGRSRVLIGSAMVISLGLFGLGMFAQAALLTVIGAIGMCGSVLIILIVTSL